MGEGGLQSWDAMEVLTIAAERGDLALMQYLLQQRPGYQPDIGVLAGAAGAGCTALAEWLVTEHPVCTTDHEFVSPYVPAATNGDLAMLTALRRWGVPWGVHDVVVQVVRQGCAPWVIRWLMRQRAPVGSAGDMDTAVASALEQKLITSLDVTWLRGLPYTAADDMSSEEA